jgi:hypothetical protein
MPYRVRLNQPKTLTFAVSCSTREATHPMVSCTHRAVAIALRVSIDAVLIPNHMSVAKPRMEPPARRDAQIAESSGTRPYKEKVNRGKNVHDSPKKIAMKRLMINKLRSFIGVIFRVIRACYSFLFYPLVDSG